MNILPLKFRAIMLRRGFAPIVVIIAFAVVVLLGGGAVVAWKTSYLDSYLPQPVKEFFGKIGADATSVTSNTQELPGENSQTATADATKDWKTYTNTELGFSFKYPGDWVKDTNENTVLSLSSSKGNVLSFYNDFRGGREEPVRFEEKYYTTFDGSAVYTTIYYGLSGDDQAVVVDGTFYPKLPGITFIYGFDLRSDPGGLETLSLILSTLRIL